MTKTETLIVKRLRVILIIGLLLTLAIPFLSTSGVAAAPQAQPALLDLAQERPDQTMRLIVQKADDSQMAEAMAKRLGGDIVADLSMIHAFAVNMEASQALELSRSPYVSWISLDGAVESTKKPVPSDPPESDLPENTYLDTLGVRDVWAMGYDGTGITVAVIDSGVQADRDFSTEPGRPFTRIEKSLNFSEASNTTSDSSGHGTHVAGIIGGHGGASDGLYSGIAPKVEFVNLRVSDDYGMSYESDVVAAMQWVYENKDTYNIRVVNLSIQSAVESSYHQSPMDAAAEILWFNGVVVVAAAGNWGETAFNPIYAAPANDPFIITVGAFDEKGTVGRSDDVMATFSADDETLDYHEKPELLAPGKDIISVLADISTWDDEYPDHVAIVDEYIRLSGTSMAAPMVTGAVALLLQAEPNLTPDQVKYRLTATAQNVGQHRGLDVYAALTTATTESANVGIEASQLLWSGDDPVVWGSVAWNSVAWNSVAWNSVAWNSVAWNSVAWNSVAWNE